MLVFSQKILNLGVCLLDSRWAFHFFYNTDIIVCMLDWSGPLRLMGDGGGGTKHLKQGALPELEVTECNGMLHNLPALFR